MGDLYFQSSLSVSTIQQSLNSQLCSLFCSFFYQFERMDEHAYTVTSDSETTGEEKSSSAFPEAAIGIDIGTAQCSAAIWNGSQVELLKDTRNQKIWRSYVTWKDEIPSSGIGSHLSDEHHVLSGAAIFNMKRLVGRVDTDPIVHASKSLPFLIQTLDIGVRPFIATFVDNVWRSTTSEEALAIFLVDLRIMAESQLKRPIRNVVLSTPVSFSRFQLTRIQRACAMAGLNVLRLMPEPTAVALLFAQQQQQMNHDNTSSASEKIALVFNMGAGYCDVAVAATAGGVSQIKALAGSAIGGEDFLQNMMRHLLPPNYDNLFSSHGVNEIKSMGLLRAATQDAIHKLSSERSVPIDVVLGNGLRICKEVNRKEFEDVNQKIFEKCESLIIQCLHDAKVTVDDLTDVIVVGGCSYIPKIKNLVTSVCKRGLYMAMHPLEAAVCGAALEGAVASGMLDPLGRLNLLTIQATPLAVGIRANGNSFVPIIPRNATMPARRERMFTTVRDNQTEVLIVVYEGDADKVGENHLLGYFKITGIPPAPKGVPEISVCMDIDASNLLGVLAGVRLPGSQLPVVPVMGVRMPNVDDGHGWVAKELDRAYGSNLDLMAVL